MSFTLINRRELLAGAALSLALPAISHATSLADLKTRGVLNVATEDDYQPFEFFQDNKLTGYDVELLALLEPKLPFKVNDQVVPWTGILPGVSTGKYDLAVTAILITKERLAALDFTSPIAQSVNYYLKRTNDSKINSIKDLSGLKVGVEAGSAMLSQLPQLDAMLKQTGGSLGPVQQYQGYPEAYQDLALGRLDVVVNTQLSLLSIVAAQPKVFALGQAVSSPSYIAWATQKGNTDLVSLFDNLLLETREDGSMAKLQKKWFNTTFPSMPKRVLSV